MTAPTAADADQGVYFDTEDYATFWQRTLILGIDGFVVAVAFVLLVPLEFPPHPDAETWLLGWLGLTVLYLAVAEAFVGTLGFLVTGMRIVNLRGERPSVWRMLFRLGLWLVGGPFHPLLDLCFLAGDPHRQTVRDKLAGTYVVHREATPAGTGKIRAAQLMILCWSLYCPEVRRAK